MGGGVVGLVLLAAALVLLWPTPRGLVRIESDDPNVEVVFDKSGPTVKGADTEPIACAAGEHGISIKRGDFAFEAASFVLKKGETITLKVELLQGKVQLTRDGKVIATKDFPPQGKAVIGSLPAQLTNNLGMELVLVPKGKFLMGGGGGTVGDKEVEIPYDFYLGKYEVTQEEWHKVMGSNPSHFSLTGGGRNEVANLVAAAELKKFPVENVSWEDAQLFLEALNKREKETRWKYRLPKESEWEYACRGGELPDRLAYAFSFYFSKPTNEMLAEQANYKHENDLKRTCKVGSYQPNRLGLYDMHGNVFEWCDDLRLGRGRAHRGGCFGHASRFCQAGHAGHAADSHYTLGLRVARVPVGQDAIATTPKPAELAEDAWLKQVAGLSAVKQVEAVVARLKTRNPGFDGNVTPAVVGGVVKGWRWRMFPTYPHCGHGLG